MIEKVESTPAYLQLAYIDACIEQTMLWMNGKSVHRNEECTTDFSCCYPDLKRPENERQEIGIKKLDELHQRRQAILSNT